MESKSLPNLLPETLLTDASLWKRKQEIQTAVFNCLEAWNLQLSAITGFPPGKVSRGENLEACPWQILDFPKAEMKVGNSWFRILCWWGHGLSIHWMLAPGTTKPVSVKETDVYFGPELIWKMAEKGITPQFFEVSDQWQRISREFSMEQLGNMEQLVEEALEVWRETIRPPVTL